VVFHTTGNWAMADTVDIMNTSVTMTTVHILNWKLAKPNSAAYKLIKG